MFTGNIHRKKSASSRHSFSFCFIVSSPQPFLHPGCQSGGEFGKRCCCRHAAARLARLYHPSCADLLVHVKSRHDFGRWKCWYSHVSILALDPRWECRRMNSRESDDNANTLIAPRLTPSILLLLRDGLRRRWHHNHLSRLIVTDLALTVFQDHVPRVQTAWNEAQNGQEYAQTDLCGATAKM